jgi:hypothetical protein
MGHEMGEDRITGINNLVLYTFVWNNHSFYHSKLKIWKEIKEQLLTCSTEIYKVFF